MCVQKTDTLRIAHGCGGERHTAALVECFYVPLSRWRNTSESNLISRTLKSHTPSV